MTSPPSSPPLKKYISCFGCPMLDLVATVTKEFLDSNGLESDGNVMVDQDRMPIYRDLYCKSTSGVTEVVGGAAQNTARVCQWALSSAKTVTDIDDSVTDVLYQCVSVGCVGNDEHGRKLATCTAADGVRVEYAYHPSLATGVCAVLVNGENRCLVSNYGAWMEYPLEHLDGIWDSVVQHSVIVYMSGFFVQSCSVAAQRLVDYALRNVSNTCICVNLSAEYVCKDSHAALINIIQYADVVFGNYSEAAAMGVATKCWSADANGDTLARNLCCVHYHDNEACVCIKAVCGAVQSRHKTAVLTHGHDPVVMCTRSDDGSLDLRRFPVPAVENVEDTNGAGDAFVAGYLCGIAANKSREHCVHLALACAARVIQECGCAVPKTPLTV